jgi:hypothetical protein
MAVQGVEKIARKLRGIPNKVEQAQRGALRKVAASTRRVALRELSAANGIPQKALKIKRRVSLVSSAARQGRNTGNTLIDQLDTADSMDELRTISEQIHDLHSRGMISDEQKNSYDAKIDTATERVQESESGKVTEAANRGAEDAAKSKVELAGTFSANAALGMGFGTSLQERTAKAAEETAKNTGLIAAEAGGRYS